MTVAIFGTFEADPFPPPPLPLDAPCGSGDEAGEWVGDTLEFPLLVTPSRLPTNSGQQYETIYKKLFPCIFKGSFLHLTVSLLFSLTALGAGAETETETEGKRSKGRRVVHEGVHQGTQITRVVVWRGPLRDLKSKCNSGLRVKIYKNI